MSLKIGIQLYTLREEIQELGLVPVLEKLSELGYQGVEFAGYYDTPADTMKKHLDRLGLEAIGSHIPLDDLQNNLEEIVAYNHTIGASYIICPYSTFDSKEDIDTTISILKAATPAITDAGLNLLYHNHDHEFEKIDDTFALDLIANGADINLEIDTHWVQRAGIEPIDYLLSHQANCNLIHLKDITVIDGKETDAAIGEGCMDIVGILRAAKSIGHTWAIVENDTPKPTGFACAHSSISYLKSIEKEV